MAVNTHRKAATTGAERLVPPVTEFFPYTLIFIPNVGSPIAEISGITRCVPVKKA